MTRVKINAGVCGYIALVSVEKDSSKNLHISVETECEMVRKLVAEIAELDFRAPFSAILHNPVYRAASANLKHPACPVPSGILKAIEVECGVCLPRPVTIAFPDEKVKD